MPDFIIAAFVGLRVYKMTYLGTILLVLVFVCFGYAIILSAASINSEAERAKRLLTRAKHAVSIAALIGVLSLAILAVCFLIDDFSLDIVAGYSSTTLPFAYKLSALWAGSAGSLLLWSTFVFILFALWQNKFSSDDTRFKAIALSIGSAACMGFSAILLFFEKPFACATVALEDGAGLNPLLQNFWMIIHPPLLFLGYSALFVPFVLTVAAVFSGRAAESDLYRQLRHWLLFGICFLTAGIVTGAKWSYIELGWGGYWAWDPVENASLLPWLIAVAALHARIGAAFDARLKLWTVLLAPLAFILSLLATFITRSGILASVHAFGRQSLFSPWLAFIAVAILLWLAALLLAVRKLPVTTVPNSQPAKLKAAILFWTILAFVFTAAVVAVATLWPVLSKIFAGPGPAIVLTRSFYDRVISAVAVLLALIFLVLSIADLKKRPNSTFYLLFCLAAAAAGFAVAWKFSVQNLFAALVCAMSSFVLAAVLISLWSKQTSQSRFAASLSHLGLFLLIFAAALAAFEKTVCTPLARQQSVKLGRYEIIYDHFRHKISDNVTQVGPVITLKKNGLEKTLWPHQNIYTTGQKSSEVALHSSFCEDIYLTFDSIAPDMRVIITAKLIPFAFWLWLAMLLMVLGPALAVFAARKSGD